MRMPLLTKGVTRAAASARMRAGVGLSAAGRCWGSCRHGVCPTGCQCSCSGSASAILRELLDGGDDHSYPQTCRCVPSA